MNRFVLAFCFVLVAPTLAHAATRENITVPEAFEQAEKLLDIGGNPSDVAAKLRHTRGLTKDELRRLDVIDGRCGLLSGSYDKSEKLFAKLHKATPDDARITELLARSLEGDGKGEAAFPLLQQLAAKDAIVDGDSYWALAQLADKFDPPHALEYARAALKHPLQWQSADKEIETFISSHEKAGSKNEKDAPKK